MKMRTRLLALAVVVAGTALTESFGRPTTPASVAGKVVSVDANAGKLVITPIVVPGADGNDMTVATDANTKFAVDGKGSTLKGLSACMDVVVTPATGTAVSIEANSLEDNFQIEVTTTNSPQDFICRFVNPGTLHVDWGDGSANDHNATTNASHTYAKAGVYTIRMSGTVNGIDFFIINPRGGNFGTPKLITAIKTPIRGIAGLNSAFEMFKGCENIPSIPEGLFDQCPEITTFYDTFIALRKVKSIPPGLFDKQTNVTSFFATFFKCEQLKEIPPGLFDKHPNNRSFAWTFGMCYSLKSVPAGLFDHHTKVTKFDHVFFKCTALRSIPPLLFDKNTNVTDYSKAFEDCRELTGEGPVNSAGKKLWELSPTPNGTTCFLNCTKLTDYATIPTNWKSSSSQPTTLPSPSPRPMTSPSPSAPPRAPNRS